MQGESRHLSDRLVRSGLWALQWPYSLATHIRNFAYDRGWKKSVRVPCPVVCIGNLTLGGTGKTPAVEAVARYYSEQGLVVAIISRGYGSAHGPNDEALVLEENLPDVPHLQGSDRVAIALAAVTELECDIIVMDDGYQHRRLARDLDIVLIDVTRPLKSQYLFPRGMLRESRRGLQRAGIVLLTRCDQVEPKNLVEQIDDLKQRLPAKIKIVESTHEPIELCSIDHSRTIIDLKDQQVALLCGIGNPTSFRKTVYALGASIFDMRTYPDHHPYTRSDVEELRAWAQSLPPDCWIVTTQKDWVKLRIGELSNRPLFALRIGLQIRSGEDHFHDRLQSLIPTGERA